MTTKSLKVVRKTHPNSLAAIKPYQYPKGVSGNAGSGNGYSLTSELKHSLNKPLRQPGIDAPAREHLVFETIKGAMKREATPLNIVWDRVDGKLKDDSKVINFNDIKVVVVYEEVPQIERGIDAVQRDAEAEGS